MKSHFSFNGSAGSAKAHLAEVKDSLGPLGSAWKACCCMAGLYTGHLLALFRAPKNHAEIRGFRNSMANLRLF